MSDNFRIDVCDDEDIKPVMLIAFRKHSAGARFYAVRQPQPKGDFSPARPLRMVFFWVKPSNAENVVELPFAMKPDAAADFAINWLAQADYGKEPDHDGDNEKGWRVYNECWGHVDDEYAAIVAVAPCWMMYGK